jgi:NitT/TauT family transport system ATP-binding protein
MSKPWEPAPTSSAAGLGSGEPGGPGTAVGDASAPWRPGDVHHPDPGAAHITVKDVSKAFASPLISAGRLLKAKSNDRRVALRPTSFVVHAGEFVTIVGPSGCGKTTMLRMIAGLTPVDTGQILIGETAVRAPGRDRAVVFQQPSLLPWATVIDNVAFGLRLRGVSRPERRARAAALVELVGLAGFESHLPGQLSGGMQQRVGLARALAIDPQILLLDEPFGSLDEITRRQMQDELLRLWGDTKLTSLLVTHSVDEALILSDRILVMGGQPGRIVEELAVNLPRPRTREVELTPEFARLRQRIWDHLAGTTDVDDA